MRGMTIGLFFLTAPCLAVLYVGTAPPASSGAGPGGGGSSEATARGGAGSAQVARGEYLVHHVAMCIQCHTPRDDRGELQSGRLLAGAPMPLESPWAAKPFATTVPKIAGLPGGWTRQEMIEFLQTGVRPQGTRPQAPMPPFRMNAQDAAAVAAYLESLR